MMLSWIFILILADDASARMRQKGPIFPEKSNCKLVNGKEGWCLPRAQCAFQQKPKQTRFCSKSEICCVEGFSNFKVTAQKQKLTTTSSSRRTKRSTTAIVTTPPATVAQLATVNATASLTGVFVPNLRVKGCGVKKILTEFVVGGTEADYWPWMTAIFVRPQDAITSRFVCGGTVISRRYILTAAHCLGQRNRTIPSERLTIRTGGITVDEDGEIYNVSSVKIHRNFRDNLHYDDIALLRTDRDIASKDVLPVCLPSPGMYNSSFYARNATVIGWGAESFGGVGSRVLRQAVIPVVSNKRCDSRYKRLGTFALPRGIVDTQICAGTTNGSSDACQGDSGGPLVVQDQGGKWVIAGIVSFGYRCAEPEYPGVYTRVSKYLPWLWNNTDIPAKNAS